MKGVARKIDLFMCQCTDVQMYCVLNPPCGTSQDCPFTLTAGLSRQHIGTFSHFRIRAARKPDN